MCGRFVSATPPATLAQYLGVDELRADDLHERYNVAPTDPVYAAFERDGRRLLDTLRWGLVPHWAKDAKAGAKMINARAETLLEKPAFRRSFSMRRCLVPADGFYEWERREGRPTQPWFVRRVDGEPLALAGLWSVWHDPAAPEGTPPLRTVLVITTEANDLVAPIHERMPTALPPAVWDEWLDPASDDVERLHRLLVPLPSGVLERWPVSVRVNNVRNDGPQLLDPIDPSDDGDAAPRLF